MLQPSRCQPPLHPVLLWVPALAPFTPCVAASPNPCTCVAASLHEGDHLLVPRYAGLCCCQSCPPSTCVAASPPPPFVLLGSTCVAASPPALHLCCCWVHRASLQLHMDFYCTSHVINTLRSPQHQHKAHVSSLPSSTDRTHAQTPTSKHTPSVTFKPDCQSSICESYHISFKVGPNNCEYALACGRAPHGKWSADSQRFVQSIN